MGQPVTFDMNKEANGNVDITFYDEKGFIVCGVLVMDGKVHCQILDGAKTLAQETIET